MNNSPKLKLELTVTDKLSEILGWLAIILIWILLFSNYFNLPEMIPSHYNLLNQIDGYNTKTSILFLPCVATAIFIGLTILNKYPYKFYPFYISSANIIKEYTKATKLIRNFKLVLAIAFVIIEFLIIKIADKQIYTTDFYLFTYVKWIVLLPLIYLTVKTFKFI
jgi:hypothetical protein